MIGDYFLDRCLTACCSIDSDYKYYRELFMSMNYIFEWYDKEIPASDKPLDTFDKIQAVTFISKIKANSNKFDISKIIHKLSNGKFKDMIPVFESHIKKLSDEELGDILEIVTEKRKLCELLTGKQKLMQLLSDIDSGNYMDESDIIKRWEDQLNTSYTSLMEIKRLESVRDISTLNLRDDDYEPVLEKIMETIDATNSVKTGFYNLDSKLPAKGFEPRRLYLIGGSSGIGKSNMLVNLICNAVKGDVYKHHDKRPSTFLYITAENLIDESLIRLYCCMTGESYKELTTKIENGIKVDLKKDIRSYLDVHNTNIIFVYVQMNRTTIADVESIVCKTKDEHNLRAVYLDYLDLISSSKSRQDIRFDLGDVASGLKNIAVSYDVPVITATQLNRSGYDLDKEPSLTQMGESMFKINHSDCVLYLQPAKDPELTLSESYGNTKTYRKIRMTLLKNRNGPIGAVQYWKMLLRVNNSDVFNYRIEEMDDSDLDLVGSDVLMDESSGMIVGNCF